MTTDGGGNPRSKGKGMQWKSGWPSKKPFDLQMPFFEGFLTNNIADPPVNRYYLSQVGQGLPGAVGGFWIGGVLFIRPSVTVEVIASYGDGSVPLQGWSLSVLALANTTVRFSVGDSNALTSVDAVADTSDPDAVTPALVIPVLAIYDQVNHEIRLHAEDPATPATAAFAGPYVTPNTGHTSFGGFYTGSSAGAAHLGLNGLVGGNFIPTVPEVTAWFDAVKSALKTSSIPAKTAHLWAANDYIDVNTPSVPAPHTITDEIGGTNLFVIANQNGIVIDQYGTTFDY